MRFIVVAIKNCWLFYESDCDCRQVLKTHEPVYQAIWVDNIDFDEVLISPAMIQDHMPDTVLAALNKVSKTICFAKIICHLLSCDKISINNLILLAF